MKLFPVALALFYRQLPNDILEIWTQTRIDDGLYHGLLEFPGGGIEPHESPVSAAAREVFEEVGIYVDEAAGKFMGVYSHEVSLKNILLYVFLFPDQESLNGKGEWLKITREDLSRSYQNKIPAPNHRIIDDLYLALYDGRI